MEVTDAVEPALDENTPRSILNAMVAVTVALLATFMGICKVKDDNIVQAMQQAQADKIDDWGWYQAKKTRIEFMKGMQLQIVALGATSDNARQQIAKLGATVQEKEKELAETKAKADGDQKTYDDLNIHDDQFDLSESSIAISISLLAVAALTQKRWLFYLALVPAIFGVIMGLAGLLGWGLHPDALAKLLGA